MADAVMQLSPQVQMWVVFGIILVALAGYASEKVPKEVTSIGVICALMLFFQFSPVEGDVERLGPARILQGQSGLERGFGLAGDGGGDIAHRYS